MAVDYSSYQADPIGMAMQGFKDAGAIQASKQQREIGQQTFDLNQMKVAEYKKAQAKQGEFQSAIAGLGKNPAAKDYQKILDRFPSLGAAFNDTLSRLGEQEKKVKISQATNIYAALKNGSPDIASRLLQEQHDAAVNAGDKAQEDATKVLIDQIKISPQGAADTAALFLANSMGSEEFADFYDKVSKTSAEQALQPGAIAKQDFELIKLGTDMGIPPEQTQKIIKSYRGAGLSPDTSESLLSLEAGTPRSNIYDLDKRYKASKELRDEYNKRFGNITEARINYDKMLESAKIQEGLGDVALITSFMKMLDEGSTVRESEFATARDTAGLRASLDNYLQKARTGEFLNAPQRKVFTDLAGKYLEAAEKDGAKTRKSMEGIVDRLGLNRADVFVDVIEEDPAASPLQVRLPNGKVTNFNTQAEADAYRKKAGL